MLRAGGCYVWRPLAKLFSQLAMPIKATPYFAVAAFWEVLPGVVFAKGTCGKLKTEYACVVTGLRVFKGADLCVGSRNKCQFESCQ